MNTEVSSRDSVLVYHIAQRAIREVFAPMHWTFVRSYDVSRELVECHTQGCPLDFVGLLNAPPVEFSLDILGIRQHINIRTGRLENFWPRYAKHPR